MKRRIAALLIIALLVLPLSGCYDIREINELALVTAVGIDWVQDSNSFRVTVQVANPQPAGSNGQTGGSTTDPFVVFSATGKTIFDAVRNLVRISAKQIMWAHNSIIIIGENLAKYDITPVIDYYTHSTEVRMKTPIVVSEGEAMDYLASKTDMHPIPGTSLAEIYRNSDLNAKYIQTDLLNLCQQFYSKNSQPILSMISFSKSKIIPDDGKVTNLTDEINFGGAAIFIKNKMIGSLAPDETKGMAWVLNQTHNATVTVEEPEQKGKNVTVEITDDKCNLTAQINKGTPEIVIKITGHGSIVEEDGTSNLSISEFKEVIGGLVNKQIVNDIHISLAKTQKEYKSDVLGFANILYADKNAEWNKSIKKEWGVIFPKMTVTVLANIEINRSTLKQVPMTNVEKAG